MNHFQSFSDKDLQKQDFYIHGLPPHRHNYQKQKSILFKKKVKRKGSPYLITEHRVRELIPVPAVSRQVTWVINPVVGCHYFPPGLQLSSQPLRGLLPISLLGEQRHDGCEQFAYDCYPKALRLRFEPRLKCAQVQHANLSATEPPTVSYYDIKNIKSLTRYEITVKT